MKPHDSDPKEERYLSGRLVVIAEINVSCDISTADQCELVMELKRCARDRIQAMFATEGGVDCEDVIIVYRQFDPD
jgi:hypothetical protein